MTPEARFEAFSARKTREAQAAALAPLVTTEDGSARHDVLAIGSDWTRRLYDGAFHLSRTPPELPAVSLVFVQSRDGNTVAGDPDVFGGGAIDKHFLYEGLSRVAADAVLAGSASASGRGVFFSVWHPEIVALRAALGLARHPAQLVVSRSGQYELARLQAFDVSAAPVFVITTEAGHERLTGQAEGRPWIHIITAARDGLRAALGELRSTHGITRISAVGGARVATALVDAGVVQDLYLTTTTVSAGEPGTPFYRGTRALEFDTIVSKIGAGARGPIRFEHIALGCGQG